MPQGRISRLLPDTALRRVSLAASVLVPTLLLAWGGYARRWAGDDGFINFRVVEQLLAGNGFVFNAGERAEVVTSPGWVLVLWLCTALGFELDRAAWIVALLLSTIGMACVAWASFGSTRERSPVTLVLPLGTLIYAALPASWDYATSALENGLGLGYLGVAYLLVWRTEAARSAAVRGAVAAFVGLFPYVRPDYALFAAPLIVLLIASERGLARKLTVLVLAGLPGLVLQLFRMGYFASLVPNTALAKEAFESRWTQGGRYLGNLFEVYALSVPLGAALLALVAVVHALVRAGDAKRLCLPLAFAAAGCLHIVYVVRVGGDFMHARMLLPGLFALLTSVGSVALTRERKWTGSITLASFAVVVGWSVQVADMHMGGNVDGIGDERAWHARLAEVPHPTSLSDYERFPFYAGALHVKQRVAAGCPRGLDSLAASSDDVCARVALPDPMDGKLVDQPLEAALPMASDAAPPEVVATVGFRPLGISGNVLGLRINVVDHFGLADPLAARTELAGRGRPGHEKSFSTTWFAAKYGAPGATRDPGVLAARRALDCGLLRELSLATREPLTFRRFMRNIALSFPLHGVRVPLDPEVAERVFCKEPLRGATVDAAGKGRRTLDVAALLPW